LLLSITADIIAFMTQELSCHHMIEAVEESKWCEIVVKRDETP
jgi:hypothetical protein